MDIIRTKEILTIACRVEVVQPGGCRIRNDGRHKFRFRPWIRDQGLYSSRRLAGGHSRTSIIIGKIRFVECKHPFWCIRSIDQRDGFGGVRCKCHHGDVCSGSLFRGRTGDVETEGDPMLRSGDLVEL